MNYFTSMISSMTKVSTKLRELDIKKLIINFSLALKIQSFSSLFPVLTQSQKCKISIFVNSLCRQQIIGHRDPKLASKDSLRSFYGVDRVDNGYFISENFSESLIERDYLFLDTTFSQG